jgi:quercetin dioxygenase-like cupin family protein
MKLHLLFCLTATLLTAQAAAPEVEITAEPHHHLTFENKSVRVFNVEVAPNTETLTHWHRHDYISVTLGAIELTNAVKDKPPVTAKLPDGDVRFVPATFAHYVRDLSDHPFRNVTVEIREDESLRNSTAKWDEDRGLAVLDHGTKQILFVKDAVRATEYELQPAAVIPAQTHPGPYPVIAVTDLDLRGETKDQPPAPIHVKSGETKDQPPAPIHVKSGDSKWLLANSSHTITNTAATPAKFVTLEFP